MITKNKTLYEEIMKTEINFVNSSFYKLIQDFKPVNTNDLINCCALASLVETKETAVLCNNLLLRKNSPDYIVNICPEIDLIVKNTYGWVLYKEQQSAILEYLFDLNIGYADVYQKEFWHGRNYQHLLNIFNQQCIKKDLDLFANENSILWKWLNIKYPATYQEAKDIAEQICNTCPHLMQ